MKWGDFKLKSVMKWKIGKGNPKNQSWPPQILLCCTKTLDHNYCVIIRKANIIRNVCCSHTNGTISEDANKTNVFFFPLNLFLKPNEGRSNEYFHILKFAQNKLQFVNLAAAVFCNLIFNDAAKLINYIVKSSNSFPKIFFLDY